MNWKHICQAATCVGGIENRAVFLTRADNRTIPLPGGDSIRSQSERIQAAGARADQSLASAFDAKCHTQMGGGRVGHSLGKKQRVCSGNSLTNDLAVIVHAKVH